MIEKCAICEERKSKSVFAFRILGYFLFGFGIAMLSQAGLLCPAQLQSTCVLSGIFGGFSMFIGCLLLATKDEQIAEFVKKG